MASTGRNEEYPVASHQVVSERTAYLMRQLLSQVVEAGTGISAQIPGYEVGGKTGTADKLGEDGRYTDITMASFVGSRPDRRSQDRGGRGGRRAGLRVPDRGTGGHARLRRR